MTEGPLGGPRPFVDDPSIAVIFTPKDELGEDRIINNRNAILDSIQSNLISATDIEVLNESETAALVGGFSDTKSVRVIIEQKSMGKASPITKSQIETVQKQIVKRTGKVLEDNFKLFIV